MQRRTLLSGLALGFASALGGCTLGPAGEAGPPTDEPVWNTTASVPFEPASQPLPSRGEAPTTTPDYGDAVTQVVRFDQAEDAEVLMVPSQRTATTETTLYFALANRSEQGLATNFYNWQLHKWADRGWSPVVPRGGPQPMTPLPAGEAHVWTMQFTQPADESGEPTQLPKRTEDLDIRITDGGYYAFGITGRLGKHGPMDTAYSARFFLNTDARDRTPAEAIKNSRRTERRVVRRLRRRG